MRLDGFFQPPNLIPKFNELDKFILVVRKYLFVVKEDFFYRPVFAKAFCYSPHRTNSSETLTRPALMPLVHIVAYPRTIWG